MKNNYLKGKDGQALISILLLVALALVFITTTAVIFSAETDLSFNTRKSNEIYYNGEAVIENAILRLERNPSYSGETLTFDDGNSTINIVAGPGPTQKTINIKSISSSQKFIRSFKVIVDMGTDGKTVNLVSWRENE